MPELFKPSWLSYLTMGTLAVVASWALSGCRFGNREVDQAQSSDGVTGYYETQPQTMNYCAAIPAETCKSVSTNQIPADFSSILTNPVALLLQDASTGKSILFPPSDGTYGIPIFANTDQTLSVLRSSSPSTTWDDSACTRTDEELIQGAFARNNGPFTSGSKLPLSGRISLDITYTITFAGSCGPSMQAMADCYADASKCGTHQQSEASTLFAPYVNAGSLGTADLSKVTTLGYEISYQ
jgi:hypothetical protein